MQMDNVLFASSSPSMDLRQYYKSPTGRKSSITAALAVNHHTHAQPYSASVFKYKMHALFNLTHQGQLPRYADLESLGYVQMSGQAWSLKALEPRELLIH